MEQKKTTILFPPSLHAHLSQIARSKGVSLGELVRSACEILYGQVEVAQRIAAVKQLSGLNLPVGPVEKMIQESVPDPEDLLP